MPTILVYTETDVLMSSTTPQSQLATTAGNISSKRFRMRVCVCAVRNNFIADFARCCDAHHKLCHFFMQTMSSYFPSTCSAQTRCQQHTVRGGVLRKPFCHSVQHLLVSRRTRCCRQPRRILSYRHDETNPTTSQVAPRQQSQQHKAQALAGTALKAIAVLAFFSVSSSSPAVAELQAWICG